MHGAYCLQQNPASFCPSQTAWSSWKSWIRESVSFREKQAIEEASPLGETAGQRPNRFCSVAQLPRRDRYNNKMDEL